MGGKSKSGSSSTSKTEFAPVSSTNPFYQTSTDKKGNTTSKFVSGTAGETAFNFVNDNISNLLDQYLNPTLDSTTNRAKMSAFTKNLNETSSNALQNNIINPLANNNMLRSSQATNMYKNLSNQMNDSIADYSNELLANSQTDTWNTINNLLTLYTNAYNGIANEQDTSINAALGAGNTTTKSSSKAG